MVLCNKFSRISLTISFLLLSSCVSFTHNVNMVKRLSYQTERELSLRNDSATPIRFVGHPDNLKIKLERRNNGFVASGRTYIYDVGATFNQLVEQADKAFNSSCDGGNCRLIFLRLENPDLQYTYGFQQLEKTSFKTDINFIFPENCKSSLAKMFKYFDELNVPENEVFSSDRVPLLIPIENVISKIFLEGRNLYSASC